ncbi:MAG: Lycopene cyclase [Chloroflexi bacterium]|nr:Lycopene cyclase [Chloroflexota bacterium]
MAEFDFVIAGGGVAGLSLAYQMAQSSLRGQTILIADRESKADVQCAWGFWADRPHRLDHLVFRTWDQAEVTGEDFHRTFDLRPYSYRLILGADFFQRVTETLSGVPGVSFLLGRVNQITDTKSKQAAQVMIDTGTGDTPYGARYAFDSILRPTDLTAGPARFHYLKQHYKGWEVETNADCFNPRAVTLFDFRTPQQGSLRFFTIFPFTKRRALVEYIIYSASPLKEHEYDRALANYIEQIHGLSDYRVASTVKGAIPLTDRPIQRRLGERILAIGARGGLVTPFSNGGFNRIQKDSAAIVQSLINHGHPFAIPNTSRYRLFDSLALQIIHRQGDDMSRLILRLFETHPIQRVLGFLDEPARFPESAQMLASLPASPFLKAFFRVKLLRKV